MNKSKLISLILKVGFLTIALFAGYYSLILVPQTKIPKAVLETRNILSKQKDLLLQNRLAIVQITKLNPTSARYNLARDRIYTIIKKTSDEAGSVFDVKLPTLPNGASSEIKKIMDTISSEYPGVINDSKLIFEKQLEIAQKQKEFDDKVYKLYDYFPSRDLGLDPVENKDMLLTRIEAAKVGIGNIGKEVPEVNKTVTKVTHELTWLSKTLPTYPSSYPSQLEVIRESIRQLKKEILAVKLSHLSDMEVEILTKQTNLINKYNDWIEELEKVNL